MDIFSILGGLFLLGLVIVVNWPGSGQRASGAAEESEKMTQAARIAQCIATGEDDHAEITFHDANASI